MGTFFAYINLYFKRIGLSGTQIGVLVAMQSVLAIAAPIFWGMVSDSAMQKKRVLGLLLIGSIITFFSISFFNSFLLLVFIFPVFAFFSTTIP